MVMFRGEHNISDVAMANCMTFHIIFPQTIYCTYYVTIAPLLWFVCSAGSSENPQRCLRGFGPHKGLWETDAVAEDAEEAERAGAPSAGLLTGTQIYKNKQFAEVWISRSTRSLLKECSISSCCLIFIHR